MKKESLILIGILIFAILAFGYAVWSMFGADNPALAQQASFGNAFSGNPGGAAPGNSQKTITTGTTGQGDVEIGLTPQGIARGKLRVQMSVNTHTVDLSQFDLKKLTVLEHGGRLIAPEDTPDLSGHHASGTLSFPIEGEATSFKITIKGIPLPQERVFSWP
ncbi:hypothetical protein HYU14_00140 [Candidatus Woesearchaeota archaeon]|nr:hypothetical protein [Candidatus Woesearchaeota archaeon]